jgi:hypothetical protein
MRPAAPSTSARQAACLIKASIKFFNRSLKIFNSRLKIFTSNPPEADCKQRPG